jgi:nitrogen fixation negative regulator NifL
MGRSSVTSNGNSLLELQVMALDAAANAIVITDRDGIILWVNRAFSRLTGYGADEVIGQTPRVLKSGRQDPAVYRDLWETIRSGRVWRGRLHNRRKDGSLYTEEMTITPVEAADGTVTHYIAVKHDLTAYQAVQDRLRSRDEMFRLLLENALDIITILNVDGTIRYGSPSIARILGYAPEELEGRSVFAFIPEDDAEHLKGALLGRGEAGESTASMEVRFRHKDGSWRILEMIGRNMVDDPMLAGVVVNARDITERKRVEEELARQREARIQSDKLADMGTLLAGVAHELNNPLTVVTGYCTILRGTLGDGPLGERVDKISAAAERCVRIVRNFLALARQHPPERHRVRLNQVVREAVELLAYPLRVDNVEVRLELADDVPALWADPHQLHQVLVNLITNAHHAMHTSANERRLTIRSGLHGNGSRVRLEVSDSGPGIPAEIHSRIFEPFFTTKPVGLGTGLGLPLCRGIIEAHGGSIRLVSAPGEGATFAIDLPVGAAPAIEPGVAADQAVPGLRGKSVLVVDDEPDVAGVLVDLLRAHGARVEAASDGRFALEELRVHEYDLILCDVRMPRLDGPGLYRALLGTGSDVRRRFVFLTGDTLNPESRQFVERTGALCLNKPFDFDEVHRVISRALGR